MNFDGIIGHKKQLKRLDLLLKNECIPQTMLFTGPSGIGKAMIAKRFINAQFCKTPHSHSPCLSCSVCKQIDMDVLPDFLELSPNESDIIPIGSEDKKEPGSVRWLIDRLSRKSFLGRKGVIIDGVDKTTEEGQNALLKTIEEPSDNTSIILIASSKARLIPTIISRCLEFRLYPLSEEELIKILDGMNIEMTNISFITRLAGGSVEIALMLLNKDVINEILGICEKISAFLRDGTILDINFTEIQNMIGKEELINIIINIYRQNLLSIIKDDMSIFSNFRDIYINDIQKIYYLLRTLLTLEKLEPYNLNIRNAIKGMLYFLYNKEDESSRSLSFFDVSPGGIN